MAALTPVAESMQETWEALVAGRSGIGSVTQFDASAYAVKIAGEVDFNPEAMLDFKEAKRMARFSQFCVVTAKTLLRDAGWEIPPEGSPGLGTIIGTGMGELALLESMHARMLKMGVRRISPFLISAIGNMAPGFASIYIGAKGINLAVSTACASGLHALGMAADEIRMGRIDAAVCGGVEANVAPMAFAGFGALRALSKRNDDPKAASRPFDRDADGFVIAEGCGLLLLEELDHAKQRGANILAEVMGSGATGDAADWTSPAADGEGLRRAVAMALRDAGQEAGDIDVVYANGLSSPLADLAETQALKAALGERAYQVPVTALKSMLGHMI
ncbi:MAG: beta-ketoacyl-[acyl-carrier-protein] synthase II, partial [Desulfovibrio sp.]